MQLRNKKNYNPIISSQPFNQVNETLDAMIEQKHVDQKIHTCTICDKKFSHKTHLRDHIKRHTQDKPYECDLCGKKFYTKSNLNVHKKTYMHANISRISTSPTYTCTLCKQIFFTIIGFNTHIAIHQAYFENLRKYQNFNTKIQSYTPRNESFLNCLETPLQSSFTFESYNDQLSSDWIDNL
jgi:DNA-directed RNA polymerase subunit RPC12/RpoP